MTKPQLFHSVIFDDFDAGAAFLRALGFTEVLVVRNADDPTRVEHSQFRWRDNGGLMAGSVRDDSPHAGRARVGTGGAYLVVETDEDVDAAHQRALAAGGTSLESPSDQDYGGRSATVQDPEGNSWSVGSYPGE